MLVYCCALDLASWIISPARWRLKCQPRQCGHVTYLVDQRVSCRVGHWWMADSTETVCCALLLLYPLFRQPYTLRQTCSIINNLQVAGGTSEDFRRTRKCDNAKIIQHTALYGVGNTVEVIMVHGTWYIHGTITRC